MEIVYLSLSAAITLVSLVLLLVSIQSYRSFKNTKLPFVIAVFLFFLIRGILLSISLLYEPLQPVAISYYMWTFDLVILTLLYLASLKR